ncbi:MAG: sulfite exporter TauE/SafE family protein [Arenimonas sp.]
MPIDLLVLGAALLAGLFGGVHCLAMCGGLAVGFAAPRDQAPLRHALLLNLGRVGGYVLAGAIVGGFGAALLGVARLPYVALGMRSLVGAVLLLAAFRLLQPQRAAWLGGPARRLWRSLQPLRERGLAHAGAARPLVLGLFWGWLPCGLSTTLLAAAWLEASAAHGALLMLAFGLGTLPLMVSLSWSGARLAGKLARPAVRHAAAAVIALSGLATLAGPWLAQVPALHGVLAALGCRAIA